MYYTSFFKNLLFLFFLSISINLYSQTWERTYNTGQAKACLAANDGSFLIAGTDYETNSGSISSMSLKKIDLNGNLIWNQTYHHQDTFFNQRANHTLALNDGDFLILGNIWERDNPSTNHPKLWKVNSSGVLLWELDYMNQGIFGEMKEAVHSPDGNIIIRANLSFNTDSIQQNHLIKINTTGDILWSYALPSAVGNFNFNKGAVATTDSIIYTSQSNVIYTIANDGTFINEITTPHSVEDMLLLPNGDFLSVGTYFNESTFFFTGVVAKYNTAGEQLWQQELNIEGDKILRFIRATNNGNFIAIGETSTLLKGIGALEFTTDGQIIWQDDYFNSSGLYIPTDVFSFSDRSFLISNYHHVFENDNFIFKSGAIMLNPDDVEKKFNLWVDVFDDTNDNCINEENAPSTPTIVKVSGDNGVFYSTTNNNAQASFQLISGQYTSSLDINTNLWVNNCVSSQNANLSESSSLVEQEFLIHQQIACPQLNISTQLPVLRPCFLNDFSITICNNSNITADSSSLQLSSSEELIEFYYDDVLHQSSLQIDIPILGAGQCHQIDLLILPDCELEVGSDICFSNQLSTEQSCEGIIIPAPNHSTCIETTASFDPNNKLAQPIGSGSEHILTPNTPLEYTINFQNTGTDTAFLVVIRDTLPSELLASSLRPLDASHPYDLSITEDSILTFSFPGILLPDSTVNLIGSQGYVRYHIDMEEDLALGTYIANRAAIYFDFNEPVITNYAFHTLGIPSSSTTTDDPLNDFHIYPNPSSQQITIDYPHWKAQHHMRYEIVDSYGRIVKQNNISNNQHIIDISHLKSACYFIRCWTNNKYIGVKTLFKI